jgi:hypothetical protein
VLTPPVGVTRRSTVATERAGYRNAMRPMNPRHLRSLPALERDETHAVVETEEHEIIDFEGCSEAEVDAKLKDFYAWAS